MSTLHLVLCAALLGAVSAATAESPAKGVPADRSRGALLYENHCQACHVSALHVRGDHRAQSRHDVELLVRRWSDYGKLGWSEEDAADVTDFLVTRYYTFPDPRAR